LEVYQESSGDTKKKPSIKLYLHRRPSADLLLNILVLFGALLPLNPAGIKLKKLRMKHFELQQGVTK
jgi:hypothetical protein